MKISAIEEYGLRCLLRLGRSQDGNPLTINEIAEREGLTVPNVRKLLMILREADLVRSVRGRTGGYALKGNPADITLGPVFEALGSRMYDETFCPRHTRDLMICVNSSACSVRSLWGILDGLISGVLHRIRLSDLLGGEGAAGLNLRQHLEATIEQLLGKESQTDSQGLPVAPV